MKIRSFLEELNFDYIFLEIAKDRFDQLNLDTLEEGKWMPSKKKGWSQRIDPENPQMRIQRHVHIARDKYITTKQPQVARNQNGSWHDRKSFNPNLSGIETAKDIARNALGLPSDIALEGFSKAKHLIYLLESTSHVERSSPIEPIYFSIK